ncbi:MAG: right-handed parallel beta-helix repeat-containing protein, partial [Candidatus Pacearchaeota archaeon]
GNNYKVENNTISIKGSSSNGIYISGSNTVNLNGNNVTAQALDSIGIYSNSNSHFTATNNIVSALTGMYFFYTYYGKISQNNVTAGNGIGLQIFSVHSSNLTSNNIASSNVGISSVASYNNNLTNNVADAVQIGLVLTGDSYSNILEGNSAKGNLAYGIQLQGTYNNVLKNNNGTSISGVGIGIVGNTYSNTFSGNIGNSTSGTGIGLSSTYLNNFTNGIAISQSGTALSILQSYNNTFTGTNATSGSDTAIAFEGSNNVFNTFKDTTIKSSSTWLYNSPYSSGIKFTNTKFDAPDGSVEFPYFEIPYYMPKEINATVENFNISFNKVFVNSTKLSLFEVLAKITLKGISFLNPSILVDEEDNGTFVDCISPKCVNISYNSGNYVFNVSGFSTYILKENDMLHPNSNITFPADGSIIDADRYTRGEDNILGTGDDNKIKGTATDDLPSSGIVNVNVSIKSDSSGLYFDGNAFTSPSAIFLPATITSGFNTSYVTWEFYFNATPFLPDSFTITAKSRDSAGNQEHCPVIKFLFLKDTSVEGAIADKASCNENVCAAEFSGEWSIKREKNATIDGKGKVKIYISRTSNDMVIVPLEEGVEVKCPKKECTFGRIDKLEKKNKPGNNLVSTAKVELLDSNGNMLVEAEGGGEYPFAKALIGKTNLARAMPNIAYVRSIAVSVQAMLEKSICSKKLSPMLTILRFIADGKSKAECALVDEGGELEEIDEKYAEDFEEGREISRDKRDKDNKRDDESSNETLVVNVTSQNNNESVAIINVINESASMNISKSVAESAVNNPKEDSKGKDKRKN